MLYVVVILLRMYLFATIGLKRWKFLSCRRWTAGKFSGDQFVDESQFIWTFWSHRERSSVCLKKSFKKVQLWGIVSWKHYCHISLLYCAKIALSFVRFFALYFALSEHCGVAIVQKLVGMRKFQKYIGTAQSFLTPPPNRPQF